MIASPPIGRYLWLLLHKSKMQTSAGGLESKALLTKRGQQRKLYLWWVPVAGTNTQINRVWVNAGHGAWAMPFLWCQLTGHIACRSHLRLPPIITIMNVESWKHTHTHKRLLQKISHKQIQRGLFLKNPISWASGFDMWSTQAPPPTPSTEGGRHYLAFSTVRIMKSPEQELNNACSNVQKSGIFLNAEILLQDATGHSCNCPVGVSQGVSCADLVASLNNAWWKLQFALSGGASSQFCVADGSP